MKLSVAFIVYNGSNYMEQQLDSILNQTVKVDEIVVCEDNSTDNTKEILEKYNKANPGLFKILHNSQNLGSNKNAEKAIQHCNGDIVFLSDHDDEWLPNKVERTLQYFEQNPQINGVFSNGYLMNAQSEIDTKNALWDSMSFPFTQLKNNSALLREYIHTNENSATGAAMAFRRKLSFLDQPFPSIKFLIHDRWISMNLSNDNGLGYIEDKLIKYRLHPKQETGGKKAEMQKYIQMNWDLLNNQMHIDNFQDMKYILNRIEINMHVQYQIKKYAQKLYDNTDWIKLLEEKHKLYLNYAYKHFPLLTFFRSIKKIFSPTFSR
jgi:glycosyltransferase involved in cell wall biosynthesis